MARIGLRATIPDLAVRQGFSPGQVSGMSSWFDFSDASKVTLNGADVSNLLGYDGLNYAQGSAAQQPLYQTATGINGKNSGEFTSANNDNLTATGTGTRTQNVPAISLWAVFKSDLAANSNILTWLTALGGSSIRAQIRVNSTGVIVCPSRRLDADALVSVNSGAVVVTANQPVFLCITIDYTTGNVVFYKDGSSVGAVAAWAGGNGNTENTASNSVQIGRVGSVSCGGLIGEGGSFDTLISAATVENLRNYCRGKGWGNP